MADKPVIIDSSGELLNPEEESTVDSVRSILPYFPDDERMSNYLVYLSSGWTRTQALIRAGANRLDLENWREDPKFRELDDSGYDELRKNVANSYAERVARKNIVQLLEFDSNLFESIRIKIESGEELTKDERAFALKRAGMYGIETLNTLQKLLGEGKDSELPTQSGEFDIIAWIRARRAS